MGASLSCQPHVPRAYTEQNLCPNFAHTRLANYHRKQDKTEVYMKECIRDGWGLRVIEWVV